MNISCAEIVLEISLQIFVVLTSHLGRALLNPSWLCLSVIEDFVYDELENQPWHVEHNRRECRTPRHKDGKISMKLDHKK